MKKTFVALALLLLTTCTGAVSVPVSEVSALIRDLAYCNNHGAVIMFHRSTDKTTICLYGHGRCATGKNFRKAVESLKGGEN